MEEHVLALWIDQCHHGHPLFLNIPAKVPAVVALERTQSISSVHRGLQDGHPAGLRRLAEQDAGLVSDDAMFWWRRLFQEIKQLAHVGCRSHCPKNSADDSTDEGAPRASASAGLGADLCADDAAGPPSSLLQNDLWAFLGRGSCEAVPRVSGTRNAKTLCDSSRAAQRL